MFKRGIHPDFKLLNNTIQITNHLIFTNSTIQCSIQQRQEFLMNKEKFYTLSYLIGISYDSGENWKFIGVANMSFDFIKSHFPELSNDLYVERQTKPIAIK